MKRVAVKMFNIDGLISLTLQQTLGYFILILQML
jgi:hypothetical protein